MNDPEMSNTASNRPQNTDDILMSDATLETAPVEQSSTALVLYSKPLTDSGSSSLDSVNPPAIRELAAGVVESGQLSEVENILQRLKTPAEKQEFFVHSATLFAALRVANGQLSVCLWEAAQRVQEELKEAGAWETTVEVLKDVTKEAKNHIQADYRKERSRKTIAQSWSNTWRDTFTQLVNLKFPAEGFEAELFLQDLATVAELAKPETVAPLLTEVYSERLNTPGLSKIDIVTRADLAKVKKKLWDQFEESQSAERHDHEEDSAGHHDHEEDSDVEPTEPANTMARRARRMTFHLDYVPGQDVTREIQKIDDPELREHLVDIWGRMTGTDGDKGMVGASRLRCLVEARENALKRLRDRRKAKLRQKAKRKAARQKAKDIA